MTNTFEEAKRFVLNFGQFKGMAIDHIATTDSGLKYLDWLRGQSEFQLGLHRHLRTYLVDLTIAAELKSIL